MVDGRNWDADAGCRADRLLLRWVAVDRTRTRSGHAVAPDGADCPRAVFSGLGVVLSIGKLATGQADYYLEQARGRVNAVTSVRTGVEDYYFDGPEPDGADC
jgi:hypothetical protein